MKNYLNSEANRCLSCKKPLCKIHCPILTDIPEIIKLFKNSEYLEAGKKLFENNPLSIFCSILCPHEKQCMGHCIKGIKEKPVDFPKIETFLSKKYLENLPLDKENISSSKVAIIGGGVAGISSAIILARKGFDVTIFEAFPRIGGVLRYGIPAFRLPRTMIDNFEKYLINLGVKIKHNTLIGPVHSISNLKNDGFKYIIISTGVWNPKSINIPGETLGNVHYAINYLVSPENYSLGDDVLVIGAGNVAMDAARTAKHFGAKKVTVVYRKTEEHMPAQKVEIEDAKKEGVDFKFLLTPYRIEDSRMLFKKVTSDFEITDSIIELGYSSVIIAASQIPKNNIVSRDKEIKVEKWGTIIVKENFETALENVFSCGDVVTGPKTIVSAVNDAKKVCDSIIEKEKSKV